MECRAALGELAQWDSSVHPWMEDRVKDDPVLISIHDDATSRLMVARFVVRDTGAENRRAIVEYPTSHGRPLAFYTDQAGHFGQWQSDREKRTETIISRALAERVPLWNDRFTTAPREALDAHRPLPSGVDLDALFAEAETRKVTRDFTIRFENRCWQIPEREAGDLGPGAEVVVECRLDGRCASATEAGIWTWSRWAASALARA